MLVHHSLYAYSLGPLSAHDLVKKWEANHPGQFGVVVSDGLGYYNVLVRDKDYQPIGYIGEY